MKSSALIIFLTVVLTLYGLLNTYIYIRGLQAIPAGSALRCWYTPVFWILVASFVLARFLERAIPCTFTEMFNWVGSFWLGAMAYFVLILILFDFLRVLNHLFNFLPAGLYTNYAETKLILFWATLSVVGILLVAGFINARNPKITRLDLTIAKKVNGSETLTIALASDIHLGTLIGKCGALRLVNGINRLNADIILLAGDIVDEDLKPVIRRNLGETLKNFHSRYGVYAITGNHEYIGGAAEAVAYLKAHNINYLQDTAVLIDGRFWLAGRNDRDISRFTGNKRKSLDEILRVVDRKLPVILMDHQPFNFQDVVDQGVDLQLSGHTHHGQIWPFNLITNAMYEVSWGYKKKQQTHFYVSSGFGTWGPPIRLGNRPEIVFITLHFKNP
jgi:uncharacterized protein